MKKIIIYSTSALGKSMAGPSIRAWEFAKVLSKHYRVTLVSMSDAPVDIESSEFRIISHKDPSFKTHEAEADVWIMQKITWKQVIRAKRKGIRVIIDAYDPMPFEIMEMYKNISVGRQNIMYRSVMKSLIFSLKNADGIICASRQQKDLWIGFLLGRKIITPEKYINDINCDKLIKIVPFGLDPLPPCRKGVGLKARYQLKPACKVLLWGGGIWNWFDPLTLIKAMKVISHCREDIKLVFMGIKHPDPMIPEMSMSTDAVELAKKLDLLNRHIFFNYSWIPYEERQDFLLDADAGVCTHFDHLETRYAFRTRLLDCIWAGLPIICTEGDYFADLVKKKNLGIVVPFQDEHALAHAIVTLLDNAEMRSAMKKNLMEISGDFAWERLVKPIETMIGDLFSKPKPSWKWDQAMAFRDLFVQELCIVAQRTRLKVQKIAGIK